MAGPGEFDRTLEYVYDDGQPGAPLASMRPDHPAGRRWRWRWPWRWPRRPRLRRRRRGPARRRRFSLKWPYPGRRLGDVLVFLTSADREMIGSTHERHRYITVGLLMVVTAAQAFYAATLFFSISLNKPFRSEIFFGVFFAAAVLLIDRSIISYAAPIRLDKNGNLRPPKKTNWILGIRILIALVAAILMSEMILLQVFHDDIAEQIQNDHLSVTQATDKQIAASYQARINTLQNQMNAAQNNVNADQDKVNSAYAAMNCQEFGCPGIAAGIGPGFRAAQTTFNKDQLALTDAQDQLQDIRSTNQPQINLLNKEELQAINAAQPTITNADKVLSQEEAFWQLTVKDGTVLAVRVLLSILILGIDLAPILTKLTGRTTIHDIRAHAGDHRMLEQHRHEIDVAVYEYAKQADTDRKLHDLAMGTVLFEAQQQAGTARNKAQQRADVERNKDQQEANVERGAEDAGAALRLYKIRLDAKRHSLWHHYYFMANQPPPNGGGSNGGGRGGRSRHGGGPWPGAGGRSSAPDDEKVDVAFHQQPPPQPDEDVDNPVDDFTAPPDPGVPGRDGSHPPDPRAPQSPDQDSLPDDWGFPPVAPSFDDDGLDDSSELFEIGSILWGREDETRDLLVLNERYVLYRRLPGADPGSGGIVWQAKDRLGDMREWIVVKTVPSGSVNLDQLKMLLREQRVAGVVSEYIGQILNHGDDRGFSYLVYPWYRPGSLGLYCRQDGGRRPLAWCTQVIYEVLSGLMAASAFGLVHLDLKPGNIVLDDERARVIDWGLSRKWDAGHPSTWVVRGTPFFACPEQLIQPQKGWDTPRADLFSVGATFYWLLTGEAPLQHEAEMAREGFDLAAYRALLIAGERPEPVHKLVAGVPRELGELISRWMSFNPTDRVPPGTPAGESPRAARDELAALMPSLPNPTVGQVTARKRRPPW